MCWHAHCTFVFCQQFVGRTLNTNSCYCICCGAPMQLNAESHLAVSAQVSPESRYSADSDCKHNAFALYFTQHESVVFGNLPRWQKRWLQVAAGQPKASGECFDYTASGRYRRNNFPGYALFADYVSTSFQKTVRLCAETQHMIDSFKFSERQSNTAHCACCNSAIGLARQNQQRSSL